MSKTDPNAPRDYFLTDPELRSIGRFQIPRGSKTINLMPAEAAFYLASGGLSEKDPNAKPEEEPAKDEKPASGKRTAA